MMEPQEGSPPPMAPSTRPDSLAPPAERARNGRSALAPTSQPLLALVMVQQPSSPAAEAFRSLSAGLHVVDAERPLHTFAVTSAGKREDKASAAANLAVAMAEGGRRVIVVDADLRHPELHTLFGIGNTEGLSSAVLGADDALPLYDSAVAGLRLLPAGPPVANPVEVLGAPRLGRLLDQLRDQSDAVVINSAPAAALADTAVIAPYVDGILLVVSAGRTRRDLALRAKEQLERAGARLLGVVLTGVPADRALYDGL
jgi:capsular exopolysaccharide synthesis family protein